MPSASARSARPPAASSVTGNVKFDLEIPAASVAAGRAFRERCGRGRPVWIAGSTHEGEEEAALAAHAARPRSAIRARC